MGGNATAARLAWVPAASGHVGLCRGRSCAGHPGRARAARQHHCALHRRVSSSLLTPPRPTAPPRAAHASPVHLATRDDGARNHASRGTPYYGCLRRVALRAATASRCAPATCRAATAGAWASTASGASTASSRTKCACRCCCARRGCPPRTARPNPPPSPYFVPGLPHVRLFESRPSLSSYQDYHMFLLTLADRHLREQELRLQPERAYHRDTSPELLAPGAAGDGEGARPVVLHRGRGFRETAAAERHRSVLGSWVGVWFPPLLITHRVPYGFTPGPSTDRAYRVVWQGVY